MQQLHLVRQIGLLGRRGGKTVATVGDAIGHCFLARLLAPDEHALLARWLAAAQDVAEAYVSNRRDDDPVLYRRIVIVTRPSEGPSHLVHAPAGRKKWIVFSLGPKSQIQSYRTLREALNSIRPVLADPGAETSPRRIEL